MPIRNGSPMVSETPAEIVDTTIHRLDLLDCIADEPKPKRALEDELHVSRSTIDRAVRELELLDLVTYTGDGYAITPVGRLLAEECAALIETVEVAMRIDDVLRWIPSDELDVDVRWFADAEILTPEPGNPYAMIDRHVELLSRAEYARCLLPVVGLHGHEAAHDSVVDGGAESELIVSDDVATTLLEDPRYAPLTEEMLETDRFELYVHDGPVPFFLGAFDGLVQLGADDDGTPKAMLETGAEEVLEWAHRKLDAYRRAATKLS